MTLRAALTPAVVCLLLACSCALVTVGVPAVTGADRPVESPAVGAEGDLSPPDVTTVDPETRLQQSTSLSGLQGPPDTDATITRIRVQENGTALWSLTIRMELDSESAETDFAAFQEEFEANRSSFIDSYRTPTVDAVSDAENDTGREMAAVGFEAETGTEAVPREWGFVTYRFRWEGFAPVENGTVRVGDVFEGGLFVEENGILIIQSPEGYEPVDVQRDPDQAGEDELRWEGPISFGDRRPSAEFVPEDSPDDGTDDSAGDGTDGSPDGTDGSPGDSTDGSPDETDDSTGGGSGGGLLSGSVMFGTAGIAVLAGITAFYLHRRRQEPGSGDTQPTGATTGTDRDDPSGSSPGPDEASDTDEMPNLATDEDRVIAALEAEDGRMRQSDLADELGWSPSKTSRVLSDMADEEQVEKLRIGRENVIDLADDDE